MRSQKTSVALSLVVTLLVAGGVLVAYRVRDVSSEDTIAARKAQFDESSELAAARLLAPYRLRYPATLPTGAELELK